MSIYIETASPVVDVVDGYTFMWRIARPMSETLTLVSNWRYVCITNSDDIATVITIWKQRVVEMTAYYKQTSLMEDHIP